MIRRKEKEIGKMNFKVVKVEKTSGKIMTGKVVVKVGKMSGKIRMDDETYSSLRFN